MTVKFVFSCWPITRKLQSEEECCPLFESGLCPNFSAMSVDDSLGSCQPDSGPLKFRIRVETLEGTEEVGSEFHVEACSVVSDKVSFFIVLSCRHAKLNGRRRMVLRE